MHKSSDHDLDPWIAARKRAPSAHLAPSVMKEIKRASQTTPKLSHKSNQPAWLISCSCLIAGIGKICLIVHLAFS